MFVLLWDDVLSIKMERGNWSVIELLLKVKNGYYGPFKHLPIVNFISKSIF